EGSRRGLHRPAPPPPPLRGPPPPALRLGGGDWFSSPSAEGAPGGSGSARSDETKGAGAACTGPRRPLHHSVVPLPLRCAWGRRIGSLPPAPKARPGEVDRREATRRREQARLAQARAAPSTTPWSPSPCAALGGGES